MSNGDAIKNGMIPKRQWPETKPLFFSDCEIQKIQNRAAFVLKMTKAL